MGACQDDTKLRRKNTWGNKNHNEENKNPEENNNQNNDDYIIQKRNEFYQSKEFRKKTIFKNSE